MERLEWYGLYRQSWNSAPLVPEAYAHPAKVSFGLAEQIYRYMLDSGMIAAGDVVGDPFGGIAGFAFHAMLNGLHWRGVELEPRFVTLAQQNIDLWNDRYAPHMPRWASAAIVQGDSRRFAELVGGLGAVASSPPYASGTLGAGDGPNSSGERHGRESETETAYKAGNKYGGTPGNLDNLPVGDLDAVASSPPFASTEPQRDDNFVYKDGSLIGTTGKHYGSTSGNIGNDQGDTFWAASRAIVEQVYLALKPGGYAAFVTGDFVRRGRRVPFGRQWLALCEACGFEPVAWAIAWKAEWHGTQTGLFGDVERRTDRVSFFRRLANEKNPDAAILNEDVVFVRKPGGSA